MLDKEIGLSPHTGGLFAGCVVWQPGTRWSQQCNHTILRSSREPSGALGCMLHTIPMDRNLALRATKHPSIGLKIPRLQAKVMLTRSTTSLLFVTGEQSGVSHQFTCRRPKLPLTLVVQLTPGVNHQSSCPRWSWSRHHILPNSR